MRIAMILGESIYDILMLFYLFAFAGWIYECIFVFLRDRKPINRGFLIGPILPLYGFGAVSVYLLLRPFCRIPTLLYLMGMVVATVLEYVTGWILERCFHTKWWDYSEEPYNFQGRVALIPSLFWGVLSLVMFDFLLPLANIVIGSIPRRAGEVFLGVALAVTAADLCYTVITIINLRKQLEKLYALKKELDVLFRERSETSLKELLKYSASEMSEKLHFMKRNPWLGNRRILDAFPKMRLSFGKRESVSVRELIGNMRERTEHFSENVREKREAWEENFKVKKASIEEYLREKKEEARRER